MYFCTHGSKRSNLHLLEGPALGSAPLDVSHCGLWRRLGTKAPHILTMGWAADGVCASLWATESFLLQIVLFLEADH